MADNNYDQLIHMLENYYRNIATVSEVLATIQFRDTQKDQYCFKTPKALRCLNKVG